MMRILRQCLCSVMIGSVLLACQQGVTDVGNPNITDKPPQVSPSTQSPAPTLGQLIGAYSPPSPVAADVKPPADGSPTPTAAPTVPACKTDPQAIQSITSTMDPTQIVLNDFLDYGAATDHLVAAYDAKTGAISFQISDSTVVISACTGTARDSSGGISVTLQCSARASGGPDCQVTLNKD